MLERLLFMTVIAALGIGLAVSELARFSDRKAMREHEAEISESLAQTRIEAQSALASIIRPETIEEADRSVYLVTVDGNPNGTAFVVDRERGLLATAAHVVHSLPLDDPDRRIEILNQHSGVRIPVSTARKHVGYGSFSKAVENYQPIRRDTALSRPRVVAVEETPFDAGVIVVNPINEETGENILGPNLPIATEEALLNLKAGDPIAIIGFPRDRVGGGQLGVVADSRAERGVVSAMIAPVDNARIARDPAIANLIIHRMATAGGNSGSPVLNAAGEVVGIHTHGVNGTDSNGDGLAQRADMLLDLLQPLREETRLAEVFRPAWEERLEHWVRAEDVLPWSYYEAINSKDQPDEEERKIEDIDLKGDAPFKHRNRHAAFSENALRYVADARDLNPNGGKGSTLTATSQPAFVIAEKGQYYEQSFFLNPDKDNLVYAFDYAVNNSTGFCPITTFWRREGDEKLEAIRNKGSARIHLPAEENDASRVHVIFKRPIGCDSNSRDFFFGSMSWDAETEDAGAAIITAAHNQPKVVTAAVEQFTDASNAFRQFVDCRITIPGTINKCDRLELIGLSSVHAEEISAPSIAAEDFGNFVQ